MKTFAADDKTSSAVIRKLEIIGEAAKKVPVEILQKCPQVPWRDMAGMRDWLIHGYFGIDYSRVWLAVENNIPVSVQPHNRTAAKRRNRGEERMSAWHENCILRDDVRRGTLTLADFAADLYGVRTGDAPNVYRLPNLFFDRTYPTHNLKTLVRDVLLRLSGSPDGKPVIRVQVAYGGGKTHALSALLHLAEQGNALENHQTVQEFMGFSGLNRLPQA